MQFQQLLSQLAAFLTLVTVLGSKKIHLISGDATIKPQNLISDYLAASTEIGKLAVISTLDLNRNIDSMNSLFKTGFAETEGIS